MTSPELYKKYRPQQFKQVVGNKEAVSMLNSWLKSDTLPHCLLFKGGSGMGKTTLARILVKKMKCGPADYRELNAAGQARGIDTIKQIEAQMGLAPVSGKCRVWLIDEAHMLTKDAQNAFLKMLEDTPKHVYFFLCTTDPQKLIKTIITRSSAITVKPLSVSDMGSLIDRVCEEEQFEITEDVKDKLVEVSEGSSRQALVILNQLLALEPEEHMDAIQNQDVKAQAIDLCRLLMNTKTKWPECAAMLKALFDGEDFDAESFRYMMLSYATSIMLGSSNSRAFVILDQFQTNYYDSKRAGLVSDCWTIINGRNKD